MISKRSVEDVKLVSRVEDVLGVFISLKKSGSDYEALCPFHEEKTPSFKVNVRDNFYKCFGCGKSGDSIQFLQDHKKMSFSESVKWLGERYKVELEEDGRAEWVRPEWVNNTDLSDKLVRWFSEIRGISQSTLKRMRVGESKQWMPKHRYKVGDEVKELGEGVRNVIEFNYFRDGVFVNAKYRDAVKAMRMIKGAELCFYNVDSLVGAREILIIEGEIDALTMCEIGYTGGFVSVPNGANIKSNNLVYLDSAIGLFEQDCVERILIGTDNDAAGRKLREDLAERLGKDKCYYIDWGDCKDSNEVLVKKGREGVWECIRNPIEFPIVGAYSPMAFSDDVDDMYVNGLDRGLSLDMGGIDNLIRFSPGYITTITGIPGMGKSEFVDQMILKLAILHGWKCAYYSPENRPVKLHISKLARKLIGKNWFGTDRINEVEKNLAMRFIEGKIWFVMPEKDFTLDSILETVKVLKRQKGINCFVLDAWNRLEHKYGGSMSETKYINESLTKLDAFCAMNNLHCFLVAHPTKMEKDKKTGKYMVPTLYNISGAAHFFNLTANGMCVYRDYSTNTVQVHVQKVKFSHWGEVGMMEYKYDVGSGRYNELSGGNSIFDYSNWITRENRQVSNMFRDEDLIRDDDDNLPF